MTETSGEGRKRDSFRSRSKHAKRPARKRTKTELPAARPAAPSRPADTARLLAFKAIDAYEQRVVFVSQVLDQLFRSQNTPLVERRLATELASGTVRRRRTLDAVLAAYCSRPLDDVDMEVRLVLWLGLNQILFVSRIPPHAAVDESVNLCRQIGKEAAAGFVNGILRTVLRELEPDPVPVNSLADCESNLVIRPGSSPGLPFEGIRLGRAIAPNPLIDPATYVGTVASLPQWLVDNWQNSKSLDEILQIGMWFDSPGRMSVRVNQLQTTPEQMLDVLTTAGIATTRGDLPEALCPERTFAVEDIPGFCEGWFSIQDETAMRIVGLLDPKPGERILDLCAAPGGKTTHIAERMQDQGAVLACDVTNDRLALVRESVKRLRLESVSTQLISVDGSNLPEGPFDAVLVDVPCSNTGVLGKRPEARWRLESNSLVELIPVQEDLLEAAIERVAAGGRVLYSTCSIEQAENSDVVQAVLARHPECELIQELQHFPGQPTDGGYGALIRKLR